MPNTWFAFKQFVVHQDKCAMKVTSDACLFAAWVVHNLQHSSVSPEKILDAGTGTGVLSLMLAQAFPMAAIKAIDIDADAAAQAGENFSKSIWHANMEAVRADIFLLDEERDFDFIICNPPFFENQLQRKTEAQNLAAHTQANWLNALLEKLYSLAQPGGRLALLLPAQRFHACCTLAEDAGWHLHHSCMLSARPGDAAYRCFMLLEKTALSAAPVEGGLCMYEGTVLSEAARRLLHNYYLNL